MDAKLSEVLADDLVIVQWDSALVHLAKTTLVHELADSFQRRIPVCDVRLHVLEHLQDWLVDFQEDAVVQLLEAQQLQDLPWLWAELDDTDNPGDEQQLWLRLN